MWSGYWCSPTAVRGEPWCLCALWVWTEVTCLFCSRSSWKWCHVTTNNQVTWCWTTAHSNADEVTDGPESSVENSKYDSLQYVAFCAKPLDIQDSHVNANTKVGIITKIIHSNNIEGILHLQHVIVLITCQWHWIKKNANYTCIKVSTVHNGNLMINSHQLDD